MEQPFDVAASAVTPTRRGRAVLCVWVALPGVVAAPFAFWQGMGWGLGFCAVWCAVVFVVWVRACSLVAALGRRTLTLYLGVAFPVERVVPRRSITSTFIFRTPLLRLADACVLVIFTPGMWLALPGIPLEEADAISVALLAGEDVL